MIDVVPYPTDEALEANVLGTILQFDLYEKSRLLLSPDCFTLETHKAVYKSMGMCFDANKRITLKSVIHTGKNNNLEFDEYFLTTLVQAAGMATELITHCKILYELYMKREMMRIGLKMYSNASKADVFDFRDRAEEALSKLDIKSADAFSMSYIRQDILQYFEDIRTKKIVGIPTGIVEFDAMIGGLQKSDLVIIGSYSSNGKTATALNIFTEAAIAGIPGKMYSFEMSARQLYIRQIGLLTGFSSTDIVNKGMYNHPKVEEAVNIIAEYPNYVDVSCNHINNLISDIRHSVNKLKIRYVIIDYVQLMVSNYRERIESIGYIANRLKSIANELDIPVILISQLRRPQDGTKRQPSMNMLKESGNLENAADIVWLPWIPIKEPTEAQKIEFEGREYSTTTDGGDWLMSHKIAKGRHYGTGKWLSLINPSLKVKSYNDNNQQSIFNKSSSEEVPF